MNTTKKKTILIILAITFILVIALLNRDTSRSKEEVVEETSLLVDTVKIDTGYMSIESEFAGTIISENTANIITTVTGMVEKIYVEPGTYVEEGTTLFQINDDVAQINYDKAQSAYNQAVNTAEASITNAQRSVITSQASHNTLITQRDTTNKELQAVVDTAQSAVDSINLLKPIDTPLPLETEFDTDGILGLSEDEKFAFDAKVAEVNLLNQTASAEWQSNLSQAQSALDKAIETRDNTYSSFDNQISSASQTLSNAQTAVTNAENSGNSSKNTASLGISTAGLQVDQYTIKAPISGVVDYMNVSVGNMISPSAISCSVSDHENLQVQFGVSESVKNELKVGQGVSIALGEETFTGIISEIAPVTDTKTKLYTVIADVNADVKQLPLNTTVKVSAERGNVNDAIIVPYSALQFSADKTYVYTIKDGLAVQTPVIMGEYNHENVEILEGLSKNDVLITSWSESLRSGIAVEDVNNQQEQKENLDENN